MVERTRVAAPLGDPEPDEERLDLDAGILIRDIRTDERFWSHDTVIDNYAPLLGADAFAIYCSLCCMANKEQYCWPSLGRMARHWGMGKSTVSRAVALLMDLRLVYIKRTERDDGGRGNNIYYLLEPLPIAEGVGHLFAELQRRGRTPEQAAAAILDRLPEQWEPLRRKKTAIRARADWNALLEGLYSRSGAEPGGPVSEPTRSRSGMGGPAVEWGGFVGNGAGSGLEWAGTGAAQGSSWQGHSPVPGTDRKVDQTQGDPEKETLQGDQHQGVAGGDVGVLMTDDEIKTYPLADDEVFVELAEGIQPVRLSSLVQQDILETERRFGMPAWTPCFYSAEHLLGLGGDDWTPEEERKRAVHGVLRRELESLYKEIGAFSLDEALSLYFTADIVARYHSDEPGEQQRLRGWLRYVRSDAGQGLENPAGFLRSRIESGQWPPRGTEGRSRRRS